MLELQMIGLLSRFELKPQRDYEREHRLGSTFYTVDFYLPRSRKAIEVHGKVHKLFDAEVRAKHDAIKAQWLADNGIGLLVVQYTEFEDLVALHAKLSSFLSGEQSKPEATW
jgi:very-short-patch-repair endonuclease